EDLQSARDLEGPLQGERERVARSAGWALILSPLIRRITLLLESGEWIDRFPGSMLRRVHGHEHTVLDLLDQHLMFVLVRVTVVVSETDLTHDAVPLSAFEQIAGPLGTSCLGRGLAHDDHRLVRRRRVIRRFLAEP